MTASPKLGGLYAVQLLDATFPPVMSRMWKVIRLQTREIDQTPSFSAPAVPASVSAVLDMLSTFWSV
jgi:hypothetical protein